MTFLKLYLHAVRTSGSQLLLCYVSGVGLALWGGGKITPTLLLGAVGLWLATLAGSLAAYGVNEWRARRQNQEGG